LREQVNHVERSLNGGDQVLFAEGLGLPFDLFPSGVFQLQLLEQALTIKPFSQMV
jgi:hypothetical protein